MTNQGNVYVGIDISKWWGDVAVSSTGDSWRFNQDAEGIKDLVERLVAFAADIGSNGGHRRL